MRDPIEFNALKSVFQNVSGTWITAEQATDATYWARQLREPVRFSQRLSLIGDAPCTLIEAGPGAALAALVRQHAQGPSVTVLPSLGRDAASDTDVQTILTSLGRLWFEGCDGRSTALPMYPFERQRY